MPNTAFSFPTETLPLLDEEFDRFDIAEPRDDHNSLDSHMMGADLAWDDQLDNGEEMSL